MLPPIERALLLACELRPYYHRAIAALCPVESRQVPTMAVDAGWRLYYSAAWVDSTPLAQVAATIAAHEVEHLLRDHPSRAAACCVEARKWNIAADLEINDDATDVTLPDGALYPRSYKLPDGNLAEWYYSQLPSGRGMIDCGSGSGGQHRPWELDGGIPGPDQDLLREAVAGDVREAERSNPGSVPAGVLIWAGTVGRPPALPWRSVLASRVASLRSSLGTSRADYSWAKPSRRNREILRPGWLGYIPRVVVVADTSGSMCEDGESVIGAVRAIVQRTGASVVKCDAAVHVGKDWRGGGGTDLRVGIAAALLRRPDMLVIVSDGETPWPDSAPDVSRCILLLTRDRPADLPGWLDVIQLRST